MPRVRGWRERREMILGIGSDLANIDRIEGTLQRFGARFKNRVFTELEQRKAESRPQAIAATYAKRWAAKEACSKALGTGLSFGVYWRDMGVVNLPSGKPTMKLTNGAARVLERLVPPGMKPHIHLTITDDGGMAQAFVIIEALPADQPEALPPQSTAPKGSGTR